MLKQIYVNFIKISKYFSRGQVHSFLRTQYANIPPHSKILSVGSGGQVNLILNEYVQANQLQVTSFDIDIKRKPDILGDICTYQFEENQKFDVVVMGEVLEHLHSPHLAIANLYNILAPTGKLIITVPFIYPIHEQPYDYYRYTRYGLQFLLKDFPNVSITERDSWSQALGILLTRHLMETNWSSRFLGPIMAIFVLIMWPFLTLLGWLIPTKFITTGYLVLAQKVP